jgi:hypothetical protein
MWIISKLGVILLPVPALLGALVLIQTAFWPDSGGYLSTPAMAAAFLVLTSGA